MAAQVGLSSRQPVRGSKRRRALSSSNAQASLGGQLSRRVAAGEISQEQAERTARERAELKAAYGPDWRRKVFGDRGYIQRTRSMLADDPENEQLGALNAQLLKRRQAMLKRARIKRNGGTTAPGY